MEVASSSRKDGALDRILSRGDAVNFQPIPLLLFIVLSALFVRALCAVLFTGEIDAEGTEYARIAQNLIAGNGYVVVRPEPSCCFRRCFLF